MADRPPEGPAPTEPDDAPVLPSRQQTPRTVGPYRLLQQLGEGGMGIVFAGHDDRLDRGVAIKMVRRSDAQPLARERFLREARAAASVSHPNICPIFEIGEEAGELFIVMELLEGEPLSARLARGPLPVAEAVPLALAMLSALAALHARRIVHRDLKPSNLFLTPHGLKLLDFGIARTSNSDLSVKQTALTHEGLLLGTPRYMSPEQARCEPIDGRSDLFAAGVLIYEMVVGRAPFVGNNVIEILHAVIHDQPKALVGSAAIAAIDRVLNRAMAKRPWDRYDSADAMAADLRAAAALADSGDPPRVRAMTRLIVLPFRMIRPDADTDFLAFSLPDALTSSLSSLESIVVRSSLAAARFAADAPDLRRIAQEADVDLVLSGSLLRAGDQLRVMAQVVDATAGTLIWSHTTQSRLGDVFQLQDTLAKHIVDSLALPLTEREHRRLKHDTPSSARSYEFYLRANQISSRGRAWTDPRQWALARDMYLQCVDEDPEFAPAWAELGRVYRVTTMFGAAPGAEGIQRAEAACKRALDLNPDLQSAHNLYAQLKMDVGRSRDAMIRLLERAHHRGSDPQLFVGLCQTCRYCGLLDASIAAYERAHRLDPTLATSVIHTYFVLGDYERVVEQAERVQLSYGYTGILSLARIGRVADAVAAATKMEELPPRFRAMITAAQCLVEGKLKESGAALEAAVPGLRDPEPMFYFARHFAELGETEQALEMLKRACDGGYCYYPALDRDRWLESISRSPAFAPLLARLREGHAEMVAAFRESGGPAVLGEVA